MGAINLHMFDKADEGEKRFVGALQAALMIPDEVAIKIAEVLLMKAQA